jgi:SAM-dependent methyltransferase
MRTSQIPSLLWKQVNERILNIDTLTPPSAAGHSAAIRGVHSDSYAYSSPDYWDLRRIIKRLNLQRDDVVYDLGCGLGRVVCLCARQSVRKVVGVEINRELFERCQQNVARLRGRASQVEIRLQDAAFAVLHDATVCFLFNPFGPSTLEAVLLNLQRSRSEPLRRIRFVYFNPQPVHLKMLQRHSWLKPCLSFKSIHGLSILFFSNSVGTREQCEAAFP